jgi:carbon-monoxide dehydrogenase medium subunit
MELRYSPTDGLRLGAAVPCHKIYEHPEIAASYAGLADAARIIGGWQIQSRASIGGNLCNASPAADSVPALIAYGATCQIVGPAGERELPVEQFCTGVGKNALARGEILVSFTFAPPATNSGGAYLRFIPRNEMDIAVVGVGTWLKLNAAGDTIEQARIGLGAVAPTPLYAEEASLWLRGKPATEETFTQAGDIAQKIAKPITDKRGTAEYRTHLVGVLTRRALQIAAERAHGK